MFYKTKLKEILNIEKLWSCKSQVLIEIKKKSIGHEKVLINKPNIRGNCIQAGQWKVEWKEKGRIAPCEMCLGLYFKATANKHSFLVCHAIYKFYVMQNLGFPSL